ncbi:MAG: enoyl-CoA hydratase/isomerase family protein [Bacteroidota bacterium]
MAENKQERFVRTSTIDASGEIQIVYLDRPEKANAYHREMLAELTTVLNELYADAAVRVIIITGVGERAFCAGADTNEFVGKSAEDGLHLQSRKLFDTLANAPKISIAAINGAAIGGGLELALACDMRVCAETATFRLPELEMGLTPAAGGMRRLPALVGLAKAKEMILFGKQCKAAEALHINLVSHVGADFMEVALRFAKHAAKLDPLAVTLAKKVLHNSNHIQNQSLEAVAQAVLYERKFK